MNEDIYKFLAEEISTGYWNWDIQTNERTYSKNLLKTLGYTEDEISTDFQSWKKLISENNIENDQDVILDHIHKTNNSLHTIRVCYLHKNGTKIWLKQKSKAIEFDTNLKPIRIIANLTDVSNLINKNQEIENLTEQLNNILKSSNNISIISTDTHGIIKHFNNGAERLLGYSSDEVVNIHTPVLIHDLDEINAHSFELSKRFNRDIIGFDAFVELAKQGLFESKEWTYIKKDGSRFPVQLVVTAIYNDEKIIIGFLGVAVDISELKKAQSDLMKTNEHITFQNKKLLDFTFIASHNLKTHARNINMLLQLLEKKDNEEDKKDILKLIKENALFLYGTIEGLNEIVQIQNNNTDKIELVNINEYVLKVYNILTVELNEIDAQININVSKDVNINYNPVYLESILFNLLSNAIKYRNKNRKLIVDIELHIIKNKPVLTFKDNGQGIDLDKYGKKIFGLFKTFHNNIDAKGIGLYITKTQIESMGGTITLESKLNEGAKFTIQL